MDLVKGTRSEEHSSSVRILRDGHRRASVRVAGDALRASSAAALVQPHGAVANREAILRLPSCFSPLFSFCDEYARGRAADHEVA